MRRRRVAGQGRCGEFCGESRFRSFIRRSPAILIEPHTSRSSLTPDKIYFLILGTERQRTTCSEVFMMLISRPDFPLPFCSICCFQIQSSNQTLLSLKTNQCRSIPTCIDRQGLMGRASVRGRFTLTMGLQFPVPRSWHMQSAIYITCLSP